MGLCVPGTIGDARQRQAEGLREGWTRRWAQRGRGHAAGEPLPVPEALLHQVGPMGRWGRGWGRVAVAARPRPHHRGGSGRGQELGGPWFVPVRSLSHDPGASGVAAAEGPPQGHRLCPRVPPVPPAFSPRGACGCGVALPWVAAGHHQRVPKDQSLASLVGSVLRCPLARRPAASLSPRGRGSPSRGWRRLSRTSAVGDRGAGDTGSDPALPGFSGARSPVGRAGAPVPAR